MSCELTFTHSLGAGCGSEVDRDEEDESADDSFFQKFLLSSGSK